MIAPAWPMRFSGGALRPAMKATTFLVMRRRMKSAAASSASPPISPMSTAPLVSGSFSNSSRRSMKPRPFTGSPPMPTQVDWPSPRRDRP